MIKEISKVGETRLNGCKWFYILPSTYDQFYHWSAMAVPWCTEKFGPKGDPYTPIPGQLWYVDGGYNFVFRYEKHRTLFMLKWL